MLFFVVFFYRFSKWIENRGHRTDLAAIWCERSDWWYYYRWQICTTKQFRRIFQPSASQVNQKQIYLKLQLPLNWFRFFFRRKEKKKSNKSKKAEVKARPIAFVCKIRNCLEEFGSKDALIAHKTVAHRRIQCTNCPDLKLVVDLNKHLRDVHGIVQNSICEICGQVYTNTRSLQDHIQRKHEVHERLQCDICKEWFKSRDTIRAHMSYVHVQGPQTCSVCGKVSANRKVMLLNANVKYSFPNFCFCIGSSEAHDNPFGILERSLQVHYLRTWISW